MTYATVRIQAMAWLAILVGDLGAQSPVQHSIILREEFSIDGQSTKALSGWPRSVVTDRSRNLYFIDPVGLRIVRRENKTGALSFIGGPGLRAGELDFPTLLVIDKRQDIAVFDASARRISVFMPTGILVRTLPAGPAETISASVAMDNGGFALSGLPSSPSEIGLPLQLLDASGKLVASAGGDGKPVDFRRTIGQERVLAPRSPSGIWVMRRLEYKIEAYDEHLTLVSSMGVKQSSFLPPIDPDPTTFIPRNGRPIGSYAVGLWEVRTGLLAVIYLVPRADAREYRETADRWSGIFNTVIDLIDSVTGLVVASHTVAAEAMSVTTTGEVVFYSQADNVPRLTVTSILIR